MIETKEEYAQTWALINGQDRQVAKDFHATIEALREVARYGQHADGCAVFVNLTTACSCGFAEANNALPDWLTDG